MKVEKENGASMLPQLPRVTLQCGSAMRSVEEAESRTRLSHTVVLAANPKISGCSTDSYCHLAFHNPNSLTNSVT